MRQFAFAAAVCAALAGLSGGALAASPGLGVAQSIDAHARQPLPGNTPPEARIPNSDRGAVPDNLPLNHMLLLLKRRPWTEQALNNRIDQLYDPRSPSFHHWLTASEIGSEFGPASADVRKVTAWLASHGFVVNGALPSQMAIDFSGTAGQVRKTFATPIHFLVVRGVKHISNIRDPRIPAALAPVVAGIVSLNDFYPHPLYKLRPKYAFKGGSQSNELVAPADIATIYNLMPLFRAGLTGRGKTVALVEDGNLYSTEDWKRFRSAFSLSFYRYGALSTVHPNALASHGDCADPGIAHNEAEATVDAEWASAAAPSAMIQVASCRDTETTFGGLIALQNLVNSERPPAVIGVGFGECESHLGVTANAAYFAAYQQAAAEGISVVVGAGDEGAASCDAGQWVSYQGIAVSGLASTPFNLAVGGTDFADTYAGMTSADWASSASKTFRTARSYVPEIPWNDSCAGTLGSLAATGSPSAHGAGGFCDTNAGSLFWQVVAGGGGPSGCATGVRTPGAAAAVSGTCAGYAKPPWQSGVAPNDGRRDIPDVSLFAGDGAWLHHYVFCWSDVGAGGASCAGTPSSWTGGGGTSFSMAIFAGVQAVIDQAKGGRQGNPAPALYALAARASAPAEDCTSSLGNLASTGCIFHDITLGDTGVNCTSAQDIGPRVARAGGPVDCFMDDEFMGVLSTSNTQHTIGYSAKSGWDFATGIGTINAANLAKAWP